LITACELVRATAGPGTARRAGPQGTPRQAARPPREISFAAARRAAVTTTGNGATTASLPALLATPRSNDILAGLGKRRIVIAPDRHRDRKTKARQAFPAIGRSTPDLQGPCQDHRLRPPAA
jgi:hypothetical protein